MKYDKGFVGIGTIIAIIAVLVVGGVVYFATKTSIPPSTQSPPPTTTQSPPPTTTQTPPPVSTACNSNSPSTIKVLSPNGGEVYQAGQQITVKWQSCNVPNYIGVILNVATAPNWHQGNPIVLATGEYDGPTLNDGIETFTIPSSVNSGQYKIWVRHEYDDYSGSAYEDKSDNAFTIN